MVQRNAIANPAEGLMVYQTDSAKGFWYWDGGNWRNYISNSVIYTGSVNAAPGSISGQILFWNGNDWILLNPGN
jgi:hypothetical protein